jgi:alpha-D-xyloside xylohydrolase
MNTKFTFLLAISFFAAHLFAQSPVTPPTSTHVTLPAMTRPVITVAAVADGLTAKIVTGNITEQVKITVCGDNVIHVVAMPESLDDVAENQQPWMLDAKQSCPGAHFDFAQTANAATLTTATLKVNFSLRGGSLSYVAVDNSGVANNPANVLLRESGDTPRSYEPDTVNGEQTYHITDRFSPDSTEALYGLGQHQSGMFNYRGSTVELGQNNTDIAIPFLVSSKGYGLLWNTASFTYFDNRFPLEMYFTSLAGNAVDYYFVYGPEMDSLIHQYRSLTGHTPMLPEWSYGLFQSKDRYNSQDEILGIAAKYRALHIPIDAIVQDWFWWQKRGDPIFNKNYTDVPAELQTLHDEHIHAMISVWGLFDTDSVNFQAMSAQHMDIPKTQAYDPTNPAARDYYWSNLAGKLFAQGWDAFWLDSAEPEEAHPYVGDAILRDKQMYIGSGALYTNLFPFMHNNGVQDHWRATTDQKRVFLLTRSAFLGQQRVGATVWSGDVYSTWWALGRQISAGLNFALSGFPYWTTDIGGYHPQDYAHQEMTDAYQKLYARWYEYGVFCPIFRTHGHRPANEMWAYDKVEPILLQYDKLRYRLMPYIYSLAWRVSSDDYTIQRPLVMDFRSDAKTHDIGDEFMFGPSLLVSPVVKEDATHRSLYLPTAPVWYDFWTGARVQGGKDVDANAPLDRIPLYVRGGSIIPMGPEVEYAMEKLAGPIELRVYTGADASFNLYQDEGDNYDYEHGTQAVIPLTWNEAKKTLTIGDRSGNFPGMPAKLEFKIVRVSAGKGVGERVDAAPDKVVQYSGKAISIVVR